MLRLLLQLLGAAVCLVPTALAREAYHVYEVCLRLTDHRMRELDDHHSQCC